MKRDVYAVQEVANWLEKNACKPRDVANRTVSKRMLARLIAAQIALKAARDGDVSAAREVMDRTEGKVPDRIIDTRNVNIRIELAGSPKAALEASLQEVDGEVISHDSQ